MNSKQWKIIYWLSFFLISLPAIVVLIMNRWEKTAWFVVFPSGLAWRFYCRKRWTANQDNTQASIVADAKAGEVEK